MIVPVLLCSLLLSASALPQQAIDIAKVYAKTRAIAARKFKDYRSAGQKQLNLPVSAALDSKDYAIQYVYTNDLCNGDPIAAQAIGTGECFNDKVDGEAISMQLYCNDDDGFGLAGFEGKGCDDDNLAIIVPLILTSDCGMIYVDDDDFDDDDDSLFGSMSSFSCANSVNSIFEHSPAVGLYSGKDCDDRLFGTYYYLETECQTMGTDSVSVTCGGGSLDVGTYYASTACDGDDTEMENYKTGKCLSYDDFDDDDFDDDDDDFDDDDDDFDDDFDDDDDGISVFGIQSFYASCDAEDLPDNAEQLVARWWLSIMAIAGIALARLN